MAVLLPCLAGPVPPLEAVADCGFGDRMLDRVVGEVQSRWAALTLKNDYNQKLYWLKRVQDLGYGREAELAPNPDDNSPSYADILLGK